MTRSTQSVRPVQRFRGYAQPHQLSLYLGLGLRICEIAVNLAMPWPLATVLDRVLGKDSSDNPLSALLDLFGTDTAMSLTTAACAVVVLALLSGAFDYAGDRLMNGVGQRISASISTDTFAHLVRLPLSYHDRSPVGESVSRIVVDCTRIKHGLVMAFSTLLPGVLCATGYTVALTVLDWRFGLIALACIPVIVLIGVRHRRLGHAAARRQRAAEAELAGLVTESLHGISTVRAFGREDLHCDRFTASSGHWVRAAVDAAVIQARRVPLVEVATAVGTAALLWLGGVGVLRGWWSVGHLVVAMSYLAAMITPLRNLAKLSTTFSQAQASAERVVSILDEPVPPTTTRGDGLPRRVSGRVEFVGVGMSYGGDRSALRDLDLTVHPGERIALLGASGAGKSTMLSLIAGLYQPTSGEVLIDGRSTASVPRSWLSRQVAILQQDTFLFSGTVADNIRYGRPNAGHRDVAKAAEAALVTEFTDLFPDGLHTRVGERGIGLSGGQRQRVGIARALLVDAPIILLDEPTSGLDSDAEDLVVLALSRLVESRTVILATHRPALLRLATRTVALTAPAPDGGQRRFVTR
ncbi:ABC transporter ATP-binding protein [Allokutzneria albata]|uniref:ATP-binding cassette, subfamily B, MsbA n=1 Tax=Allokutzneria albata TaxID=211114 RepID=A0A1G9SME5_ALLAB|nr:ABC transporter ATP-binding protein [Allokutzneria albata]SDM36599.1 ATP-binding cassette, subfamily B, MsbA [Allokutzneria albata]